MASISTDKNGLRRILFFDQNGDRKSIRLRKIPLKVAESINTKIEEILSHKASGCSWTNEVSTWVGNLGDELADKLASVGLIQRRIKSTLGDFLDGFLKKRENAKPNSYKNYKAGVDKLLLHFGRELDLRNLTPGMAEDWAIVLADNHSGAYAGRLVKFARQFFHQAKREKLVTENPFEGIKAQSQTNESRKFFVTPDMARKVLEACPNAEWRLIFALARYGGLRCPSEVFALKWANVDWEKGRMLVHAPKTEHHQGGGNRVVPIFPELRPYLEDADDLAKEGDVYVINSLRGQGPNLRTQGLRIIERAGLKAWPKVFQNLRASRETELVGQFPIHVVCSWIGNSERVAVKHYLQVTEEDFAKAKGSGAEPGAQTTQNAARQFAAPSCTNGQKNETVASERDIVPVSAGCCNIVQDKKYHLSGVLVYRAKR